VCVCGRVLGEIGAGGERAKEKEGSRMTGIMTNLGLVPCSLDPSSKVGSTPQRGVANINTLEDCVKLHTYSGKPCKQIR